ncbi:MAG TPA: PAS domain S-box protein [Melioribacteraceae bacterium]|nr:PAS domain S-box protein [Melioribacteraceae bacterium]
MDYNNYSKEELINEITKLKTKLELFENYNFDDINSLSQLLFENAFYNSPEGIMFTEGDTGKIIALNYEYTNLLGYKAEEIIGKSIKEIGIWINTDQRRSYIDQILLNGFAVYTEDFRKKDGTIINLSAVSKLIKIKDTNFFISYINNTSRIFEELKRSERKYKLLSENIKDVIWELDPNTFKFTYVSPSVFNLRGYTAEEVMEAPFSYSLEPQMFEIVKEKIKQRLIDYKENYIIPDEFFRNEIQQTCKDGRLIWTEVITNYFVDEETGKLMIRGVTRDIEGRKKGEERLKKAYEEYKTLFENASETIILIQDGIIKKFNKAAFKLTGYNEEEISGHTFLEYVMPEFRETVINYHKRRLNDEILEDRYNVKIKIKNNDTKWVSVSGVKIMWQNKPATLNFLLDITELKEIQEKLIKQNEELLKTNNQKDKLFSILSHDLKNPLHVILALSDILTSDNDTMERSERYQFAKDIKKSAKALRKILDDLLNWAKLKQNLVAFAPKSLNLSELINDAFLNSFDVAREKNISINIDVDDILSVWGDENLLKSLFRNLFTNAIKFSKENSKIDIAVALLENKDIIVKVQDYGIGMPKELAENLFELGYKIQRSGTNNEPSTGLGLQIVKHIAEVHNAELWFDTEENKGTAFFIKFLYKIKQ